MDHGELRTMWASVHRCADLLPVYGYMCTGASMYIYMYIYVYIYYTELSHAHCTPLKSLALLAPIAWTFLIGNIGLSHLDLLASGPLVM